MRCRSLAGLIAVGAASLALGVVLRPLSGPAPDPEKSRSVGPSEGEPSLSPVPVEPGEDASSIDRPSLEVVLAAEGWPLFRLLGAFLPEADAVELAVLAEAWGYRVEYATYPAVVWKLLLARWVELSPQDAVACERRLDHYWVRGFCYQTWGHLDYEAALRSALSEEPPAHRYVIREVAKRDPRLGLSWINRESAGLLLHPLMETWARHDADGALEAIQDLEPVLKARALRSMIPTVAETDTAKALEWAQRLDPGERDEVVGSLFATLVKSDPDAAETHLEALPRGEQRGGLFTALVRQKAQEDPQGTWQWAQGLPAGDERREAILLAAESLAGGDSRKLLALFDDVGWENAIAPLKNQSFVRVPNGWSRSGYPGAVSRSIQSALEEVASEDPTDALAILAKIPRTEPLHQDRHDAMGALLRDVAHSWFRASPTAALEWMERIPEREIQRDSTRGAMQAAEGESLDAVESYLTRAPPGSLRNDLSLQLVKQRIQSDLPASLELFDRLDRQGVIAQPDGVDLGIELYGDLAGQWYEQNPEELSEWLAETADGPRKDAGIGTMVSRLTRDDAPDYEAAFQWAQVIQDEGRRERSMGRAWRAWNEREPDLAGAALEAAGVTPEMAASIRGESSR